MYLHSKGAIYRYIIFVFRCLHLADSRNFWNKVDIFTKCCDYLTVIMTTSVSVLFLTKYAKHSGLFWTIVCMEENEDT